MTDIAKYLDFKPTDEQQALLKCITDFFDSSDNNAFILKGTAGTGKTSILKAVVNHLSDEEKEYVLLAPTGRAARNISEKTGFTATTIHSHMYRVKEVKDDDDNILYIEFIKRQNPGIKPCVYLIDEASMVGDTSNSQDYFVSKKPLLEDLLSYIKEGHKDNKIIFMGDPYQLSPINADLSPALSEEYLQIKYQLQTDSFELTEVKRQEENSYILENAIQLRHAITNGTFSATWQFEQMKNESNAVEHYCQKLQNGESNDSIFIAWKNVSINNLNEQVRKLLNYNNILVPGERLIISQSNYAGIYLSSGTFLIVDEVIGGIKEIAGYRFATVKLRFPDSDTPLPDTFKIDINSLLSENGRVDHSQMRKLWHERYRVNKALRNTKDVRTDKYLSALKVRYGYAITTHKAQGGEWNNVYLYNEIPFGTNGLRWLYTSITRAREHLYSFQ